MNLPLEEISLQATQSSHALLLLVEPVHKLGRHKTGEKPLVPGNISLLQLPSYSPGLNPVDPSTGPDSTQASGDRGSRILGRLHEPRRTEMTKPKRRAPPSAALDDDTAITGALEPSEKQRRTCPSSGEAALCCPSC